MTSASGVGCGGRSHAFVAFTEQLESALDGVADTAAWSMTPAEEREVLVRLAACAQRVTEIHLRVLAAADRDDVGKVDGSPSTGAWLAGTTHCTRGDARTAVRLARALDDEFVRTRLALGGGRMRADSARAVVDAVQALPHAVPPSVRRSAEERLVELAERHDARELRVLGRRIYAIIDPQAADEELGRQLAREEREALRATYLRLHEGSDGTTSGSFRIPTVQAHMLRKALEAFTSPRRLGKQGRRRPDGTPRTGPEQLGTGLCEMIERFPADRLPGAGTVNATVVVTMSLDQLRAELAGTALDTGALVSAGEVRRLACSAGVIPAVLGGESVPLDLGRERRLHSRAQRIALGMRQQTCAEERCDRPAAWCEAHHRTPWSHGGATSLENGELLCSWHHHRAHDPDYRTMRGADGAVRFHRRT